MAAGAQLILVTGATGFVGRVLCEALLTRGYAVRAATRGSARLPAAVVQVQVGELGPHTDWNEALRGVDTVVHLAARTHVLSDPASDPLREYRRINTEGTARLATAAAQAGVRRFVFLSSIKVNGEYTTADPYSAQDTPHPEDAYGVTKWEAERALRAVERHMGMGVVVLRPPLVYGPGVKANFRRLMQLVARGVPLPLGGVRNRRSMIYVENLADAICACIAAPQSAGRTYLVSDGTDLSTPDLIRALALAFGVRPRLFAVPVPLLAAVGAVLRRPDQVARLTRSLQVDSTPLRNELGWRPPWSVEEALAKTAAWWRADTKR
jgi:nucleoside-diphosphate-sugar epimerase